MRRLAALFPLMLLAAACSKSEEATPKAADPKAPVSAAPVAGATPEAPKLSAAHQSVIKHLNEEGLITVPAVKAKSDELMNEIRQNKMTISQGAEVFDKWLTEYIAAHPKEVAEAKAARAAQLDQARRAAAQNPAAGAPGAAMPAPQGVKPPTP